MATEIDSFPQTRITPRSDRHSTARRTIDISHHIDGPPRGETYSTATEIARIDSCQTNGGPFSPPRLLFYGMGGGFTRAEWERVKREVDQAFDAFEATWPLDRDGDDGPRVERVLVLAEHPK